MRLSIDIKESKSRFLKIKPEIVRHAVFGGNPYLEKEFRQNLRKREELYQQNIFNLKDVDQKMFNKLKKRFVTSPEHQDDRAKTELSSYIKMRDVQLQKEN